MGKDGKHCCANCDNCVVERPFGQQVWNVCARDVNGPVSMESLKEGIITTDINQETDCLGWVLKGAEEPDLVSVVADLVTGGKHDLMWKRLGL